MFGIARSVITSDAGQSRKVCKANSPSPAMRTS
jgi:hypothetical protein